MMCFLFSCIAGEGDAVEHNDAAPLLPLFWLLRLVRDCECLSFFGIVVT